MFARCVRYVLAALLPSLLLFQNTSAQVTNAEYQLLVRQYRPASPISALLSRNAVPVRVSGLEVPDTVVVGQEVSLAAHVNLDSATLPLEAEWTIGGGPRMRGLVVRHVFQQAGEYEVRLRVANPVYEEERVMQITARAPDGVRSDG